MILRFPTEGYRKITPIGTAQKSRDKCAECERARDNFTRMNDAKNFHEREKAKMPFDTEHDGDREEMFLQVTHVRQIFASHFKAA